MSKTLRKSDIRQLNEQLPVELSKKDVVVETDNVLLVNDTMYFFRFDDEWVPAIPLLLEQPDLLPRLVVDMGAIRFVVNGADIMRPGIVEIPDVEVGSFVQVVDENNKKPIAIGKMTFAGESAREMDSGNVVENLHFVGDDYWETYSN